MISSALNGLSFFGNRISGALSIPDERPLPRMKEARMSKRSAILVAALFLAPAGAVAQQKGGKAAPPAGAAGGDSGVIYRQKTVYDFDDDIVEGALVRPDGEFVDSRRGAKHSSLIKIRQHFIDQMLKSAEDI
jgi:hypothetical protein